MAVKLPPLLPPKRPKCLALDVKKLYITKVNILADENLIFSPCYGLDILAWRFARGSFSQILT